MRFWNEIQTVRQLTSPILFHRAARFCCPFPTLARKAVAEGEGTVELACYLLGLMRARNAFPFEDVYPSNKYSEGL